MKAQVQQLLRGDFTLPLTARCANRAATQLRTSLPQVKVPVRVCTWEAVASQLLELHKTISASQEMYFSSPILFEILDQVYMGINNRDR